MGTVQSLRKTTWVLLKRLFCSTFSKKRVSSQMGGREEPWCSTGVMQNKVCRWMHWKLVFTQRANNLRHSAGMRIRLLRIHLLTGQQVEREPVLAWNIQPCDAFLHSQRFDPQKLRLCAANSQVPGQLLQGCWAPGSQCEEQGGSHDTGPTKSPTFPCLSHGFCWLCTHVLLQQHGRHSDLPYTYFQMTL